MFSILLFFFTHPPTQKEKQNKAPDELTTRSKGFTVIREKVDKAEWRGPRYIMIR